MRGRTRYRVWASFTIRGGIIDIFPIQLENPVRIELFDIEIDSIRMFDPKSQRSFQSITQFDILQAKEFIFFYKGISASKIAEQGERELSGVLSGIKDKELAGTLREKLRVYMLRN